eukprot:SAG11_NODE_114_length_16040_cov_10.050875_11_plen_80_part_00
MASHLSASLVEPGSSRSSFLRSAEHNLFSTLIMVLRNHPGEVTLLSHACVAIGNLAANYRPNQDLLGAVRCMSAVSFSD